MAIQLAAAHMATYDMIFQHPIARDLEWRDVKSMLGALSDSVEERADNVKFTRNAQTLVIRPPRRKDFSNVGELMNIRRFLERSSVSAEQAAAAGVHILVVIDHRMARIYKTELHGSVPHRILPFDRNGTGRHLHYVENDANGKRKPEQRSFYEAVARTLGDAENIIVFGSGTGASSAMDQLLAELREHYHSIAKRIVRTVVIDEQHLSEDQLLAKARDIYSGIRSPTAALGAAPAPQPQSHRE